VFPSGRTMGATVHARCCDASRRGVGDTPGRCRQLEHGNLDVARDGQQVAGVVGHCRARLEGERRRHGPFLHGRQTQSGWTASGRHRGLLPRGIGRPCPTSVLAGLPASAALRLWASTATTLTPTAESRAPRRRRGQVRSDRRQACTGWTSDVPVCVDSEKAGAVGGQHGAAGRGPERVLGQASARRRRHGCWHPEEGRTVVAVVALKGAR